MITCLRADNPGPMTLTGTNTWLVRGETGMVVVDPGPPLPTHLAAIQTAGEVELIILTHRHADHSALAPDLALRTGAPVRAVDRSLSRGGKPLVDGEVLPGGLVVVATPGHTDDSICLLHSGGSAILTGDTVLGTGSSVIMYGDGSVADSLASLQRILALVEEKKIVRLLPGHGPEITDPAGRLRHDLAHRHDRIAQVRLSAESGVSDVDTVTIEVHAGLDPRLVPAARTSIAAHLAHLGLLSETDPWLTERRGQEGRGPEGRGQEGRGQEGSGS